jgi:hypothetical protein
MICAKFQNMKYKMVAIEKYNIYINVIFTKYNFFKCYILEPR